MAADPIRRALAALAHRRTLALLLVASAALAAALSWSLWRSQAGALSLGALGLALLLALCAAAVRFAPRPRDSAGFRAVAVVAHELRQPLHALTLYVNALERRIDGAEARDILAKIDRAALAMSAIIAAVHAFARLESGVVAPTLSAFALQEMLTRIAADYPGAVEAAATDVVVRSDPDLLEQALRALVANAIAHGGGRARIEVARRDGRAEIAIADDGPGIAPEHRERVFEPFVRLEPQGGDGLGLGLALVRRIAELLHARLRLASARGQGARFTLSAPLADERRSVRRS